VWEARGPGRLLDRFPLSPSLAAIMCRMHGIARLSTRKCDAIVSVLHTAQKNAARTRLPHLTNIPLNNLMFLAK